jgi:hypothetical protein
MLNFSRFLPVFRLVVFFCCFSAICYLSKRSLLFADNSSWPFSRPGVGMGSLPSNRQSPPVTQPPIRTDFHEPFDVHGDRFAQVPFHHSISLDDIPDAHRLIFGQILYLCIDIDGGLLANLGSPALADSKDIGQAYLNPLIQRQIHSCDSSQFIPPF